MPLDLLPKPGLGVQALGMDQKKERERRKFHAEPWRCVREAIILSMFALELHQQATNTNSRGPSDLELDSSIQL